MNPEQSTNKLKLATTSRISFFFFLATLIFTPVAFATVEIWSYTVAHFFILTGLFFYLTGLTFNKKSKFYYPPGLIPILLFCSYVLIQAIPLPPGMLKILSPKTWEIYAQTIWLITPETWMPVSLIPKHTVTEFFRISSSAALYILTVQLLSVTKYLKTTVFIIAILVSTIAFLAIIQRFTSPEEIYWVRKVVGNNPFGPWVNRNHYAGFMEMALPLLLAMFLYYKPKIRYGYTLRQRLALAFSMPEANIHTLLGLGALLVAVSIFISLSRSGIICTSISLLFFAFLSSKNNYSSKNIAFISTFILLIILSVSWFGWQPIIKRFEKTLTKEGTISDARPQVWHDSSKIIKDFPVTGTGFGTFLDTYRAYITVPGRNVFTHAHNDYIELLSTGGIISLILSLCFFISLFRFTINTLKKRRERFSIILSYASVCSILAMLLHSITDFNLQIGANTIYFFFFCGLMVSSAATRRYKGTGNGYLKRYNNPWLKITALPAIILLITAVGFQVGQLNAASHYSKVQNSILYKGINKERISLLKQGTNAAINSDSMEPRYHLALANIQSLNGGKSAALPYAINALKRNPLSCQALQHVAISLAPSDSILADSLFKTSVALNQRKGDCISGCTEWFFNKKDRAQALSILKQALLLNSSAARYFFPTITKHKLSDEEIALIFPEDSHLFREYAQIKWKKGNEKEALKIYEKSLLYIENTQNIRPWFFHIGYNWYIKHSMDSKAFNLMQKAVQHLPEDASLHNLLGDLYAKQKIPYRALQEYNKALTLDPGNKGISEKIKKLSE